MLEYVHFFVYVLWFEIHEILSSMSLRQTRNNSMPGEIDLTLTTSYS
jgi:hypothetical protein